MYAPALIVDVTWWAPPVVEGEQPNRHRIPLRPPLRDHVLGLYSMLRRYVDPTDPSRSYGDIVVRPGVGIPVALGRPLDAIAAQIRDERDREVNTLRAVVPLLDQLTYNHALAATRASLTTLQELADDSDGRVLLLPVTLYDGWDPYLLGAAPVRLSYVPEARRLAQAASGVGTNLATWIMRAGGAQNPKVTIFVSHAKLDLAATDSAAIRLDRHIEKDSQIKTFFDARQIDRGRPIAEQLAAGQRDAVLLSLRTDHYADSAWCHEEVLTAKSLGMPVISVWSVRQEELRALPYGGNMPTLVWDDNGLEQITNRCLQAWLHHLHFKLQAPTALALTDLKLPRAFLSRPPELVDFALGGLPVDRDAVVLYPDPPMPAAETRLIRLAHPRVRLATPTTLFGGAVLSADPAPPLANRVVALSLSDSPVANAPGDGSNADGFNALHVQDAIAHLTLCIVRAGARLAYGGHLLRGGFTPFLASIIAVHNSIGATTAEVPLVYLAAYLRDKESDIKVERVDVGDEDLVAAPSPDLERRVGEALQLRNMRIRMAQGCDARVAIGGKDQRYQGRFPGIVEECLRMLEAGKPIYPIGGFGGAAELAVAALLGPTPELLRETKVRQDDPAFAALCDAYDRDERRLDPRGRSDAGPDPATLDELAARVAAFGTVLRGDDPEALWTNGLTVAENKRLFCSRDLTEIAHLVMKGLAIALPKGSAPGVSAAGAMVRLFRGSITDVEATEAYAVPVVSGLAPTGAALALDERLAGRIRDRLQEPILDVEAIDASGARLAGRTVILVPLANTGEVELTVFQAPIQSVQDACARLAAFIKAHKIKSIATVPFGANIGLAANASVEALLTALKRLRSAAPIVTVCELLPDRYHLIKQGLVGTTELPASPVSVESRSNSARSPVVISVHRRGTSVSISVLPPADDTAAVVGHDPRELTADDRRRIDVYARLSRTPDISLLPGIGLQIGRGLLAPSQLATLAAHADRPIDVVHDIEAAAVPWELLALESEGAVEFPARGPGMRRRLMVSAHCIRPRPRPRRLELGEALRVLLVANPRGLPHAAREVEALKAAFALHKDRIAVQSLEGDAATVDKVVAALREPWDVLHYAGHASFDSHDPSSVGLRLADAWLTPERIVTSGDDALRIPPLVVLNACTSARVRDIEVEPPPQRTPLSPSLAEAILLGGARTFIGTFWEVYDAAAAAFAAAFYRRLLAGDSMGTAVLAARRTLAADQLADWVNYNLYGDTELRW